MILKVKKLNFAQTSKNTIFTPWGVSSKFHIERMGQGQSAASSVEVTYLELPGYDTDAPQRGATEKNNTHKKNKIKIKKSKQNKKN